MSWNEVASIMVISNGAFLLMGFFLGKIKLKDSEK